MKVMKYQLFCLWCVCAFHFDVWLPFPIIAIIYSNTDPDPNEESSWLEKKGTPTPCRSRMRAACLGREVACACEESHVLAVFHHLSHRCLEGEDRPGSKPQFHSALGLTALGCSFLGGRGRGDTLPAGLLEDREFSA